ncbi:hypothetical protein A8A54_04460 [Brucella pseudogrignonensis]|uniref:hypothetical protein n=1 Tax=Brucella pseudogrignonensis TaxID=419475 RepID=UPI0007DA5DAF|nr:hypothetical protein [Brucella pseudogrignonensis]ANG95804.1 hypothetical protein A8A54_04460 [Brucella pseudogrignonensis]
MSAPHEAFFANGHSLTFSDWNYDSNVYADAPTDFREYAAYDWLDHPVLTLNVEYDEGEQDHVEWSVFCEMSDATVASGYAESIEAGKHAASVIAKRTLMLLSALDDEPVAN